MSAAVLFLPAVVVFLPFFWIWHVCQKLYELGTSPTLELASQMAFFDVPVLLGVLGYYIALSNAIDAAQAYLTRRWEKHVSKQWPWADGVLMVTVFVFIHLFVISKLRDVCECSDDVYAMLAWLCSTTSQFFRELELYFQNHRTLPTVEALNQVSKCLWASLNTSSITA